MAADAAADTFYALGHVHRHDSCRTLSGTSLFRHMTCTHHLAHRYMVLATSHTHVVHCTHGITHSLHSISHLTHTLHLDVRYTHTYTHTHIDI